MMKPIPDKAEVALEYPDKLYIGTFERTARFDAHRDETGISLSLHRTGEANVRKSVPHALPLRSISRTPSRSGENDIFMPPPDAAHHEALRDGAEALYRAARRSPE